MRSLLLTQDVHVADPHPSQSLFLSHLFATEGNASRCDGKVIKTELGVKGQKGIRDISVEGGDPSRNLSNLLFIDIAGNKKGTGNEERGIWPLRNRSRDPLKILKGSSIRNPAKGPVEIIIPSLEVEFDTSSGLQREIEHSIEERGVHRSVGLPTDAKNPS